MIQRFVIGKPFPTESVVLDLPAETGPVPYLTPDGDGWQYVMQEKDCSLYPSDAADDLTCVDLGGRRIIQKQNMQLKP